MAKLGKNSDLGSWRAFIYNKWRRFAPPIKARHSVQLHRAKTATNGVGAQAIRQTPFSRCRSNCTFAKSQFIGDNFVLTTLSSNTQSHFLHRATTISAWHSGGSDTFLT